MKNSILIVVTVIILLVIILVVTAFANAATREMLTPEEGGIVDNMLTILKVIVGVEAPSGP